MDRKKIVVILLAFLIYVVSTGASYFLFSQGSKKSTNTVSSPLPTMTVNNGKTTFNKDLPKTEACPLNGVYYSKPQKEWWEMHGPLGIMIENHKESRPQSGLASADIIYEAIAEGGITRFLAMYYCQDAGQVGPVRSARTYFIDFASEYGKFPLYAHVGGANTPGPADALGQLTTYGWTNYNDLNQFSVGFPVFWRDYNRLGHEVATEHTMYSTTGKLWNYAKTSRSLTNVDEDGNTWDEKFISYSFTDDLVLASRPTNQSIHVEFWSNNSDYFVDWTYDQTSNLYKRTNGGVPHTDFDNKQQLTAKNIVILFMRESNANDGYANNDHLLYQNKGNGQALIFKDGKQIKGTWNKTNRTAKTLVYDTQGNPVKFNRGTIWFEILPTDGVVEVK